MVGYEYLVFIYWAIQLLILASLIAQAMLHPLVHTSQFLGMIFAHAMSNKQRQYEIGCKFNGKAKNSEN